MSVKTHKEKTVLSVEIIKRNGEVTIAGSTGRIMTVRTNDLAVTLGVVLANTMANAHDFWSDRVENLDIKMEVTAY